ncbi:peptidase inhibitor family I36 protein [Streptomyces sp. DG2A-72]|uniref:peptidase inhibitor family I36 protein n=1 Tax=Streptomyces sp. DG2A-72 TaxID=3051386 RepID=UPI00265C7C48|nr:peptidase inhibitor family I36 protein [Streptomyces sp. DG2A-72]MDO0935752.1 peptidase inhibitor family I36 protein [Streptomyces sp. DG2A-72]
MKKSIRFKRVTAAAAALAAVGLLSAGTAAADASSDSSTGNARLADASWHAFAESSFEGLDGWFSGSTGACTYVGDNWNDNIRSARTESSARVELWEHADCTGWSITIDDSGYGDIGPWVSAYRVTT